MKFLLLFFIFIPISNAATNRVIESAIYMTMQVTTPANPVATKNKLYSKSDDKFYSLSSAGVEYSFLNSLLNISTTTPLAGGGLLSSGLTLSIPAATTGVNGYLTSADWNTFNGKQSAGAYITSLTSDVTASGPGAAAATISALAVTNSKIANATIDLTAKVTGVLPVANGGTGASTLTANYVLLGNTTSALQMIAPGTNGNVLTSNGTTWSSQTPAGGVAKFCAFSVGTSSDTASNVKYSCLNSTTCTDGTANRASCTFATSYFATAPICTCTEHSSNSSWCNLITVSSTTITIRGVLHDGSGTDINPDIICTGE